MNLQKLKIQKYLGRGMLGAGLVLGATHFTTLYAAPAAPVMDAQDKRVVAALTKALKARVSSPGGTLKLNIVPTSRSGSGYFSQITIVGAPAQIKKLRVSELNMNARNVRIDVPHLMAEGKLRTLQSTTTLRAVVSESDLTKLLARGKSTREMGLRVKYLPDGRLSVNGTLNYTLINGPVSGIGRLRLAPGSKVNLDILSLKLRGREVPQFVKDQFSSRINPVINYEDLPFQPRFRGLKVVGTRAILSA